MQLLRWPVIAVSPFGSPDLPLALAAGDAGALGVVDLGTSERASAELLEALPTGCGVRVRSGTSPSLPPGITALFEALPAGGVPAGVTALVEVRSEAEARAAIAAGAQGLVARGAESGGRVGDECAFVLLQRLVGLGVPLWLGGGIGVHSARAARVGGATGVLVDSQLALARDASTPAAVRTLLRSVDGGDTVVAPEDGVLVRRVVRGEQSLLAGQDAALAGPLADQYGTVRGIVRAVREAFAAAVSPSARLNLDEALGTDLPVLQGPMTRVSDRAPFAAAVAEAGALPFLALALMRGPEVRTLLEATRVALGDLPWGVGILGFVPPELREEQLAAIEAVRPPFALIAGGRPSQARPLEALGTRVFLHVPSPGLLDLYLKDGARRFVFEGRECGGHVGPRGSFVLWEQQIERLLAFDKASELEVVFAGGIHDARSSAMVAAMAAPLVARGARVGVLMGTAYLFTQEAVQCGAIVAGFQEAALACTETALVESAPGHATRCAESPFVDHFRKERARLEAAGAAKEAQWAALEQLNLGRLRIASKGRDRQGDAIVEVSPEVQRTEGMFMIGQVAALRHEVTTLAALHREVTDGAREVLDHFRVAPLRAQPQPRPVDVAIVGMACIFPDAPDLETFWSNIVLGKDAVTEVPEERWDPALYFDPDSHDGTRTPSKWGGFLAPVPFDPLSYGIPPKSLAAIDPVQLLALEVARRALDDAGYATRPFDRERASVVFGAEAGTDLAAAYGFRGLWPQYAGPLPDALDQVLPSLTEDSFPGVLANVISGRIANRLDFGGANYTVDAACASSLAAVDNAVKLLVSGESDLVVAGGADLHNAVGDYLLFASVHALSRAGRCKTFSADADGIALGEGVAAVVLKRLEDARRDGDRVVAVIRGIGASSDGKSLGLTAPRKEGQVRALHRAYAQAGVSPKDVGLVEAHGTGTVVGDRTELATLSDVWLAAGAPAGGATLGSVKSNIGHTKCAAGLAGLIKAALAVNRGVLPPTLHLTRPNPGWSGATSPFGFRTSARPWLAPYRAAGVSAFGFGGTNFHVVLDSDAPVTATRSALGRWPTELVVLRGTTAEAVRRRAATLRDALASDPDVTLLDVAAACARESTAGRFAAALVVADLGALRNELAALAGGGGRIAELSGRPVVGLFPGQGSQRVGMGDALFVAWPELRAALEADPEAADALYPNAAFDDAGRTAQAAQLTDTRRAQPALGMVDLAVARLLERLGLTPTVSLGHSYGELAALAHAGAFTARELVALSRARGEATLAAAHAAGEPGTMAAIGGDAARVGELLSGLPGVGIANLNAPDQTVISGTVAGLAAAIERLTAAGLTARAIPVACAFHSPLVAAAGPVLAGAVRALGPRSLRHPVLSNVTAAPHEADLSEALGAQLGAPVRFVECVRAARELAGESAIFVELGPGRVLSGLVKKTLGRSTAVVAALPGDGHPLTELCEAVAQLLHAGVALDVAPLFDGRPAKPVRLDALPTLPKSVWWVDGHRARPMLGEAPRGALRVVKGGPVWSPAAPAPAGGTRDQVVLEYLGSLQRIVDDQRRVMLQYLGAPSEGAEASPPARLPAPREALAVVSAPAEPVVVAAASILDALVALVAERTGYPAASLDPELDLEADLSIDSIKRLEILGALGERLGLGAGDDGARDSAIEALARLKTLRAISDWLETAVPQAPPAGALSRGAPAPGGHLALALTGDVSRSSGALVVVPADIGGTLVALVAERTGYPADALDLDLDLEADLSIDSIKRLEILGAVGERIGLLLPDADRDALVERLAAKKTLRALIEALVEAGTAAVSGTAETPAAASGALSDGADTARTPSPGARAPKGGPAGDKHGPTARPSERGSSGRAARPSEESSARRYVLDSRPTAAAQAHLPARGNIRVTGAPERVAAVAAALRVLAPGLDVGSNGHSVDSLVDLRAFDGGDALGGFAGLKDAAPARGALFVAPPGASGLFGLAKSLARERKDLAVRAVSVEAGASVEEVVAAELARLTEGGPTEIRMEGGQRLGLVSRRESLAAEPIGLPPEAVVLITGGARGITARCALALASAAPCRLVLVGRTERPSPSDEPPEVAGVTRPDALRRALTATGRFETLRAVEAEARRITAAREVAAALAAIEATGATVDYRAIDVRTGISGLVRDVLQRYGRLDLVVHAAGVLEDRRYEDKTVESFQRVFETKASPARWLAAELPKDTAVVFFSSIASVYGNAGQLDYAAANDVLDALAEGLCASGRKAVSIAWGPWAGGGMVSPELEREYARRGMGLVLPDDGVRAFLDEVGRVLAGKAPARVVIMNADPSTLEAPIGA